MTVKEIVLIGPTAEPSTGRMGGVTIPFEEFSVWCRERSARDGINTRICSLTGKNFLQLFITYCHSALVLLKPHPHQHISLHLTWNAVVFFSPWIILAKIFSSKTIDIRKFAADFDLRIEQAPWLTRLLVERALSALNTAYFETHYLVDWARRKGYSAKWWPNSRSTISITSSRSRNESKNDASIRLVFIGRINTGKGVRHLISIAKENPEEVKIDLFGPVDEDELLEEIERSGASNLRYGGVLPHEEVSSVIADTDALVLPTGFRSEGYPGVIIEAAMVGVPSLVSAGIRGPAELLRLLGAGWALDFGDRDSLRAAIRDVRDFYRSGGSAELAGASLLFCSDRVFTEKYSEMRV